MLIDMHAHSSGISRCCLASYEEAIRAAQEVGLDGFILTNHYQKSYVEDGDAVAFAHRYTEEYRLAKAFGDAVGFRVFFGVEVTMEQYGGTHMLIYGVTEQFVEEHPTLYELSQEELYRTVHEAGGLVIQPHPYRKKKNLLDTRYMDGVEVNCHPLYGKSDFEDMLSIARENRFLLTCGGDYHADTYRPLCGVYLPDTLQNGGDVGDYLLSATSLKLFVHEPGTEENLSLFMR